MDLKIILGLHQKKHSEQKIKSLWKLLVKVKSKSSKAARIWTLQRGTSFFFFSFVSCKSSTTAGCRVNSSACMVSMLKDVTLHLDSTTSAELNLVNPEAIDERSSLNPRLCLCRVPYRHFGQLEFCGGKKKITKHAINGCSPVRQSNNYLCTSILFLRETSEPGRATEIPVMNAVVNTLGRRNGNWTRRAWM